MGGGYYERGSREERPGTSFISKQLTPSCLWLVVEFLPACCNRAAFQIVPQQNSSRLPTLLPPPCSMFSITKAEEEEEGGGGEEKSRSETGGGTTETDKG